MDHDNKYGRRSIRLKDYDYSRPGAYFVTIVVQGRKCFLGTIKDGEILLSMAGEIVERCWLDLPQHYPTVQLDEFCIMPNHVHGVVVFMDRRGGSGTGLTKAAGLNVDSFGSSSLHEKTRPYRLLEIVRAFKSFSARRINKMLDTTGHIFWQRGYYEHIIRDENDLRRIREYIYGNPWQWEADRENPDFMPA